jgi:diguanylate cyclase (GGDEF)-like protein
VQNVVSLKKFLQPDAESVQTLLRVSHILLQGISEHAIEYDAECCARFRRNIQKVSDAFTETLPVSEFLVLAGGAAKALDDYNQHTSTNIRQRKLEFETIITMLTETVKAISSVSVDNVERLQQIEQQVGSAIEISDVKVLKSRLGDCLEGIKKEAARQRADAEQATQSLIQEIGKARARVAGAGSPNNDPLTGLLLREAAEAAIASRCESNKTSYVAVMMVERLHLYNTRFGRAVGDDLLRYFAETVRKSLPPRDILFRWTGPTLVAVLDRACSIEDARLELKRILDKIPTKTIETETRLATLSMASRWGVFPTTPAHKLLIRNIDMFTSVHNASISRIST